MTAKRCAGCDESFVPRPQVPDQVFCSSRDCQRVRKRQWQRAKLGHDPDYRENQRAAQRSWQVRNPDYWRQRRSTRRRLVQHACPAKMDVSDGLSVRLGIHEHIGRSGNPFMRRESVRSSTHPPTSDGWLRSPSPALVCHTGSPAFRRNSAGAEAGPGHLSQHLRPRP